MRTAYPTTVDLVVRVSGEAMALCERGATQTAERLASILILGTPALRDALETQGLAITSIRPGSDLPFLEPSQRKILS